MNRVYETWLVILRVAMGWLFFYAGITKVVDSEWSAESYLNSASTFSGFYEWLAMPSNIGWVNILNEWGLTLIGLSLIFGLFVRYSSVLGALMMLMYYFPALEFPYIGEHSFLINDHIIYALTLALLFALNAGRYLGLDQVFGDYGDGDTMEEHMRVDY